MRRTIVIGFWAFAAVVAIVALVIGTPIVLLVTTWANGGERIIDGTKLSLQLNEYFFPSSSNDHLFIGRLFSKRTLIEVEKDQVGSDARSQLLDAECKALKCTKMLKSKLSVNGKTVDLAEQHYRDDDLTPRVQARFWIEPSPLVVRFSGPEAEYFNSKPTVDRFLDRISRADMKD
jgi:hypothetical protein